MVYQFATAGLRTVERRASRPLRLRGTRRAGWRAAVLVSGIQWQHTTASSSAHTHTRHILAGETTSTPSFVASPSRESSARSTETTTVFYRPCCTRRADDALAQPKLLPRSTRVGPLRCRPAAWAWERASFALGAWKARAKKQNTATARGIPCGVVVVPCCAVTASAPYRQPPVHDKTMPVGRRDIGIGTEEQQSGRTRELSTPPRRGFPHVWLSTKACLPSSPRKL